LDLQEMLAKEPDPPPVIFLTGYGDLDSCARAFKAGAVDFLTKPVPCEVLVAAVQNGLARGAARRAADNRQRSARQRYEGLSLRERQVFAAVVAGRLNKEIAAELGVAERTVKAHRARVKQKLVVRTMAELVHVADLLQQGPPPAP
jgi:FixJ family two-component response regulator